VDIERMLTEQEKKFLNRTAKRRILFLLSSVVTVLVAVSYLVYHGLIAKNMNGPRFIIILLLLLSGRSYLRLYRSAVIFTKLNAGTASNRATGTGPVAIASSSPGPFSAPDDV
jgi:hypothetical protein